MMKPARGPRPHLSSPGRPERAPKWPSLYSNLAQLHSSLLITLPAKSSSNLAQLLGVMGRFPEARRLGTETLRFHRELGMRRSEANNLDTLAEIDESAGLADEARRGYRESLRISVELGLAPTILVALAGLARLHARAGRKDAALDLLGLLLVHPASAGESRTRAQQIQEALKLSASDPEIKSVVLAAKGIEPLPVALRLLAEPS